MKKKLKAEDLSYINKKKLKAEDLSYINKKS